MTRASLERELVNNSYPGRGIIAGRSEDGLFAVAAYFIMGRSANSRNRVFAAEGEGIRTQAFDPSKMVDPSLIIYRPVCVFGRKTIVTNGDQTETILYGLKAGKTFCEALKTRRFEPDEPNFTPRISALLDIDNKKFGYTMNIIKSEDGDPSSCVRFTFFYEEPRAGEGHFLHTYMSDGDPLPSFEGEPVRVGINGGIDAFTDLIWNSLDRDNRISLFVRYISIESGNYSTRIVNKYGV